MTASVDMTDPAELRDGGPPVLDVVVPVLNEEIVLARSVRRLHDELTRRFPVWWRITIVDNGSVDRTREIAFDLAATLPHVGVIRLDQRGRGLALRTAWSASDADVVAYMDVDLSTGLDALLPLVAPVISGHSDIAIGSRLIPGASVARGPKREFVSRGYNLLLHSVFANGFHDAQCGFKAMNAELARRLLPAVHDDQWFFDTELLMLAERNGVRIHEVPVDWVDDPDSRVDVMGTALADLRGVARLAWRFSTGRARVDLGTHQHPGLADDFGRARVTTGVVAATSVIGAGVIVLALRPLVGPRLAVLVASVAVVARIRVLSSSGRRRPTPSPVPALRVEADA